MMERAIYAEEELQEVPIEYQDMWEFLDEVLEPERVKLMARRAGKSSRDGGGWPLTVASPPLITFY